MNAVVLFAWFVLQSTAPAPAPDPCAVYSLEGLRLGATTANVTAVFPSAEIKWSDANTKAEVQRKSEGGPVFITMNGDALAEIAVDYTERHGTRVTERIEPALLLSAFVERFGEPTSRSPRDARQGSYREIGTVTAWQVPECDCIVTVTSGRYFYHSGSYSNDGAILRAVLARLSRRVEAAKEKVDGVVKF